MTDYQRLRSNASGNLPEQQQMLLDFAVSHSPAIFYIAVLEADRPVKFISSNVATITGHTVEAFLSEAGYGRRFVHPEDLPDYAHRRHDLIATGELKHEYRFRTTDGDYLWFRDELRLVDGGEEREIVGCMIEITQEKAAEAERARMAQLFQDAVESLENGFSVADAEGRIVACNSALVRNFQLDRSSFIGKPRKSLLQQTIHKMRRFDGDAVEVTEEWIERIHNRLDQSIGAPIEVELEGGRWVLLTSHPTSEGGRVTVGTNITALKRVQNELRQSERYFRSMVEDNPLPVWLVDLETSEVLYASPSAAKLVGRAWPFQAPTFSTDFFVDLADREILAQRLRREDGLALDYETCFRRADGKVIWVALSSRLIEYQGRTAAITGIVDLTERKRRELELRQAQETLEDAIESLSEGFVLYDAEDRLVLCNEQYKAFNGEVADLLLPGAQWSEIIRERIRRGKFPDAAGREDEFVAARLAERGKIENVEFRVADGHWFEHSHRPTRQGGVVITWRDITERRQRREALRQAHETLEDAIESLVEGFALYDAGDRLVMCNQRYREFNRVCADILKPGMPFLELVRAGAARGEYDADPARIDRWIADYEGIRATGGSILSFEYETVDGRWFSYSSQPTRRNGRVCTLTDITERKKMEQEIRDSEAVVRLILDASPVILAMVRAEDGQILYESPAAAQVFGYDPAQGDGSTLERWPDPEARKRLVERLRRTGAIDALEVELQRSDGTVFPAAISGRLIEYKGEEVVISSVFDLTERVAMDEEMRRQREILHQSEKMSALGQLLASVAHELNNPLSVVVGQALLLKETAEDKAVAKRAERIGNAAERCARIVKTFLAMARQQPQESLPVDLNELIESALEVTAYALRASDIEVSMSLSRSLPMVMADADQLTQVFTNLLVNAGQALRDASTPRRLRITSRLTKRGDEVLVKIKDNGPGVPEDIRGRIFDPFFTTKEVGSGTGMGLSICHRILEAHKGRIKLENTPGGGATFVVRLPAIPGAEAPVEAASDVAGARAKLSILVVDDESEVAELLVDVLGREGHRIEIASSGKTALARIRSRNYDLVLSDIRMPGMDGPSLYRSLRDSRPEILPRIAFITGDTLSPDIKTFLEESGRPYIEKPVRPQDVRALVNEVAAAAIGDGSD